MIVKNLMRYRIHRVIFPLLIAVASAEEMPKSEAGKEAPLPKTQTQYLSERLEAEHAIEQGLAYLRKQQHKEGYWSNPKLPALTALALTAFTRNSGGSPEGPQSEVIARGYKWLRAQQKPDGGIYGKGLASYNTACSIMAFLALGHEEDRELLLQARGFLVNQQTDWQKKLEVDTPYDGGVGYGGSYPHSDMSNTYFALEALYHTKVLAEESGDPELAKLDWEAALTFLSRCQNLKETNDQAWASNDAANKGGFIYFPGDSKAGEEQLPDGTTALRSYGSMTYAGLLSFIYCDLDEDDPRVQNALAWLGRHYTLEENPGLGAQGLFYYYHTIAKALAAAGIDELNRPNLPPAAWKKELIAQICTRQRPDGSWVNGDAARWMENDPVLVTSYALLALHQTLEVMP